MPSFNRSVVGIALLLLALLAPIHAQEDHEDLTFYRHPQTGEKRPIKTKEDWLIRRQEVLQNFQKVSGPLPGKKVPLDVRVLHTTLT